MTKYVVKVNRCKCHPETCVCNDWAVYNTYIDEKVTTHFDKAEADYYCDIYNKDHRDER
jgi:hypothetical protein